MSIPERTKASVALARGEVYEGRLDASRLLRLAAVGGLEQPVQLRLGIFRDRSGDWLEGEARGTMRLVCARCSEGFAWELQHRFVLRLVRDEAEEQRLLADCEPYLVRNDELPLYEMVEEEILLALPMMPRCRRCQEALERMPEAPYAIEPPQRKALAGLIDLKK